MIGYAEIAVGNTATASMTVDENVAARAVGSGSLEVLATPIMIALMERAACAVLSDALEKGQTSVGTRIDVSHTAASRVGAAIAATATITDVDGRRVEFAVAANDEAGEIGSGTHTRVIVDEAKFMARARGR